MMNNINTTNMFQAMRRPTGNSTLVTMGLVRRDNNAQVSQGEKCPYQTEEQPTRQMNVLDHIMEMRHRHESLRAANLELARQREAAKETAEMEAEQARLMRIAMKIAARITRGDNVPHSDKEFLLQHSPGMFKLAMSARDHSNDDPKDYEALARGESPSPTVTMSSGLSFEGSA